MRLAKHFISFYNERNKFNNTRAQMFDSIYHMTLRLRLNLISAMKPLQFCHYVPKAVMDFIMFPEKSVLSISLNGVISLSYAASYDKHI